MLLLTDLTQNTHTVALFPLRVVKKCWRKFFVPSHRLQASKDPGSDLVEDPVSRTPLSEGTARTGHKSTQLSGPCIRAA